MANGIKVNRLLVLLQTILIPLYFLIIVWAGWVEIDLGNVLERDPLTGHTNIEFLLMSIMMPLFFSLPWVLPTLLNANRVADSYELMGRALGKVRADMKLFYGLNAAFLMVFFILPFVSPALSILGTVVFVSIWIHRKTGGHMPKGLLVLLGFLLALFPAIGAISFYMDYSDLWDQFSTWWADLLPILYYMAICVANGIVFGDSLFLIKNKNMTDSSLRREFAANNDQPIKLMFLFGLLFIFAATFDGGAEKSLPIDIINMVAIGFSAIVGYVKWRRRLSEGGAGGMFIMFVFMIVNLIRGWFDGAMTVVIVLSGVIFISLFVLAYLAADDERYIS